MMSYVSGTDTGHALILGRPEGYSVDPAHLQRILRQFPLHLWEELFVVAQRDLATGDLRAAMMHTCLAFETFVRQTLTLNSPKVRNGRFAQNSLKELCTKRGCLPLLIGGALNSSKFKPEIRTAYERIAKLRDHLLHQGTLTYVWLSGTEQRSTSIETTEGGWEHLNLALGLVEDVGQLLAEKGHSNGLRGLHRCSGFSPMGQSGASMM
jgi:hypothetical protein